MAAIGEPEGRIEMVLDRIVRPPRQRTCDVAPAGTLQRVYLSNHALLLLRPAAALAVAGAHVVEPALPALLAGAARDLAGDHRPCMQIDMGR